MEMELNKPSDSDLLQKMQHHPSSSALAALGVLRASEIARNFRLCLSRLDPYARTRRSPPPPGE